MMLSWSPSPAIDRAHLICLGLFPLDEIRMEICRLDALDIPSPSNEYAAIFPFKIPNVLLPNARSLKVTVPESNHHRSTSRDQSRSFDIGLELPKPVLKYHVGQD